MLRERFNVISDSARTELSMLPEFDANYDSEYVGCARVYQE
jgi:hypothetical protein